MPWFFWLILALMAVKAALFGFAGWLIWRDPLRRYRD